MFGLSRILPVAVSSMLLISAVVVDSLIATIFSDLMSWYHDPKNQQTVDKWEQDSYAAMLPLDQYYFFGANDREAPLEQRFPTENIPKLKDLKRKWDPNGVFTSHFL